MITVRRSGERPHVRRRRQEVWRSFEAPFGGLEVLDEINLSPGAGAVREPCTEVEVVTYVHEGALAHEDSLGRSGITQAGEFQCMTVGRRVRHSETNASRINRAHAFQIWLRPAADGGVPDLTQKRFSAAERRDGLCLVASPDGRKGSLRLHQDAFVYSALLDPGQHEVHEVAKGRSSWLHLVEGEVTLDDVILLAGDGAGFRAERAISLTAREKTEFLLVDLADPLPEPDAPRAAR